ncbi:MAG: hypothetical protein RRA94_15670, partial [Bacteroidota bacterium]|nr:hypothetical protein [Bacteroidota bacterium]
MTLFRPFLVYSLIFLALPLSAQVFDAPADEMQQVRNIELRRHALLAKRSQFVALAAEDYDVTYYRLAVSFPNDAALDFSGSVRMELRSLVDDLSVVTLNFGALGSIDSVHVDGTRLAAGAIAHDADILSLTLPSAIQTDDALA